MPSPNLKSLSVVQLLAMRDDIDKQLEARRSDLQAQLAQIGRNGTSGGTRGSKVPPKYQHPATGETWSGRGGVASWLAAELKKGRKLEDFLIARAPSSNGARPATRSRTKPKAK